MGLTLDIKGLITPFSALGLSVRKPHTLNYPRVPREPAPGYRGFHVNDLSQCAGCGNCQDICMNEAIDMVRTDQEINPKNASGLVPRIDYGRCCWCGLCTDVCGPDSLRFEADCIYVSADADSFLYMPKNQA
jgi:formate hydrogenlyase subunit 6/NADH:ubiquinone oxidoreductase subunit I